MYRQWEKSCQGVDCTLCCDKYVLFCLQAHAIYWNDIFIAMTMTFEWVKG